MDLLFRPGTFIRAKTPIPGSSLPDANSFSTIDDNNEDEEGANRLIRPASRVSSYIGLASRQSNPTVSALDAFPNLRDPYSVYHKPSVDQQAEMLKVVMMNKSFDERIPAQYDSTILHVLESYQDLRTQLDTREEHIEVLKQTHTKDIEDFEGLAAEWEQKENDYKLELKTLEVLLARTEGGLEAVTMARSKSVVHGAEKASTTIARGIGTIKARIVANERKDAGIDSPELKPLKRIVKYKTSFQLREDRDLDQAASFISHRRFAKERATLESKPRPKLSYASESSYDSLDLQTRRASLQQPESLTKSQLEALGRQQEIADNGVDFGSSESGASSSVSQHSEIPAWQYPQGLGIAPLEKPLPDIPTIPGDRGKQTTLHRFFHGRKHSYSDPNQASVYHEPIASYHGAFSFRPGDDGLHHMQMAEQDRSARRAVDEHLEHQSSPLTAIESPNEIPSVLEIVNPKPEADRRIIKSKPSSTRLSTNTSLAWPSLLPRMHDNDHPSRMNSTSSSVVTAVRHDSSRSSAGNSQIGRPNVKRNPTSGSFEAMAAATRAFAGSRRSPPITQGASAASGGSGSNGDFLDKDRNKNTTASRKPSIAGHD